MKKGDIVYVDFDVRIKESGEYYRTTREEVAKENDMYDEKRMYGPVPVIVGTGFESVGFDNALLEMELGENREINVPEEEAHGKRDPSLIELVPLRTILKLPQFKERESYPTPGMPIVLHNKEGYIRMVGAGRVRVDYNHPLAGKELVYNIKAVRKTETDQDIALAIFDMHYPTRAPPGIEMGEDMVSIVLPEMCKYDKVWQGTKFMIIAALREHLSTANFQLIEEYRQHKSTADDSEGEEGCECGHDHGDGECCEEKEGAEDEADDNTGDEVNDSTDNEGGDGADEDAGEAGEKNV